MVLDWKLIFRKVLKFFSYSFVILLVLYTLFLLGTSLFFTPKEVIVSNITSGSATISWVTNFPMTGIVSYKEKEGFLPLFLSGFGAKKAYDDRDSAYAQEKCVEKFNENAKKNVDSSFTVDGSGFDCENIKVKKIGRYYVHHITIKGLSEKKEYSFRVGDRLWGWVGDTTKFTTFSTEQNVAEPLPIFGRIKNSKGDYSNDAIIFGKFTDAGNNNISTLYSSVTNDEGGWYLDGGNIRTANGQSFTLESGQDSFVVQAIYKNMGESDPASWVFGSFDGAYPDIQVNEEENGKSSLSEQLVGATFARYINESPNEKVILKPSDIGLGNSNTGGGGNNTGSGGNNTGGGGSNNDDDDDTGGGGSNTGGGSNAGKCMYGQLENCKPEELKDPAFQATVGYGNVAKELAKRADGEIDLQVLKDMGLAGSGTNDAVYIAGNLGALTGQPVTEAQVKAAMESGKGDEISYKDGKLCIPGSGAYEDACPKTPANPATADGSATPTAANDNKFEVTASFDPINGSVNGWYMKFDGKTVENATNYLTMDQVRAVMNADPDCKKVEECTFTIKPELVNLVTLILENPKIKNCVKDGTCLDPELKAEITKQITDLKGYKTETVVPVAEILSNWDKNNDSQYTRTCPSGVKCDGNDAFYSGKLSQEWVNEFWKTATEEEKRQFIESNFKEVTGLEYWVKPGSTIVFENGSMYMIMHNTANQEVKQELKSTVNNGVVVPDTFARTRIENKDQRVYKQNCPKELNCDSNDAFNSQDMTNDWVVNFWANASDEEKENFIQSNFDTKRLSVPGESTWTKDGVTLVIKDNRVYMVVPGANGKTEEKFLPKYDFTGVIVPSSYANGVNNANTVAPFKADDPVIEKISTLTSANSDSLQSSDEKQLREILKEYSGCVKDGYCDSEKAKAFIYELRNAGVSNVYLVEPGVNDKPDQYQIIIKPDADVVNENVQNLDEEIAQLQKLVTPDSDNSGGVFQDLYKIIDKISLKTYAAEETVVVEGDGYVFYLPEYGMYSLQLGKFDFTTEVANEKVIYVFYLETNGQEGFQPPVDPENPKISEDVIMKSNSFKINYEKKADSRKYSLKKGINIVSFDFIPVSPDGSTYTAKDMIKTASKTGVNIEYVSYFDGGRWVEGIKCTKDGCVGNDFQILPGKGYLLKSTKNSTITIAAYNLKSPIPVSFSAGWNLIGVHGYPKAYTAKGLITSINTVEGLTADNVSWYPTAKGRYEGFQMSDGAEYGFDFPISTKNGYFVKISKFAPKEEVCKSLIWHEGNQLHGACGDSKKILN